MVISELVLELEDVLDQVVAIGVLDEVVDATDDHVSECQLLSDETLLKAALHDTTSMLIRANLITVGHAGTKDELRVCSIILSTCTVSLLWSIRCLESQKESLDHMVAIRVRGEVEDVLRHLGSDGQDLLMVAVWLAAENLDKCLNSARSMQVHGNLDQRW